MYTQMLSCDWGTTSFRLRLIDTATGSVIDESVSGEGIRSIYNAWIKAGAGQAGRSAFYLAVINRHIQLLQQKQAAMQTALPVIVSGMASSTIGIRELPYTAVPFYTDGSNLLVEKMEKTNDFNHDLSVISGASTDTDVMRGEETQLIGCAENDTSGEQFFIFPGTHSKHVSAAAGRATGITTYMTGELFSLLADQSILAASILPGGGNEEDNIHAFQRGVIAAQGKSVSQSLFLVRINQLFNRFSKEANFHFLSGLLIGAELEALSKKKVDSIILSGEKKLLRNYLTAFETLGIQAPVRTVDAAAATIRGQLAVYRRFYE